MNRKLFFLSLICAIRLTAQIATGTIAGTVQDPTGLPVPGANVRLVEPATGRERTGASNERGDFVFTGLDAAQYDITVAANGFKQAARKGLILATGVRLPVGVIALELGSASESVSVSARAAVVQTQSSERADLISSVQLQGLLTRGRNVTDLIALMPGVVVTNQQDDLSNNATFFVQGNRSTTNNVTVDGVPATDLGNGSQLKLTVSQDNVAEVKVLLSNYQAEYGRMAGSNVQIITKSGTRDFHGLVSYFKRNEEFNANNFFNNRNGTSIPRYRFNTWTYNVGGPVTSPGVFNKSREKLFFFWGQEFWPTQFGATGQVTVPTAPERIGDFSQSVDVNGASIAIKDPNTGQTFAGNRVPASRIDANGQALLKLFPLPNFLDRTISKGQYNYVFTTPRLDPKRTDTLKLDYNLNANNTVSGGYSRFNEDQTGSVGLPDSGGVNWPMMKKTWSSHGRSWTGRYTRIITPALLNEFSSGWLSQPANDLYSNDQLALVQRDTVGFHISQFAPSANPLNIIPNATFGGVSGAANLTSEGRFPLFNRYNLFTWADNLTWNRGEHTFKAGLYAEYFRRNQKKAVAFNGLYDFGRNANSPFDTNYAYANALIGAFASYNEVTGPGWMNVREKGVEAFLQDNWRITRRLTLDYGIRFYWVPPLSERDDMISAFVPSQYSASQTVRLIQPGKNAQGARIGIDPVSGQTYVQGLIGAIVPGSGNPYNGMVTAKNTTGVPHTIVGDRGIQYGPRFGFAYDATGDGKTAIRGGGGIFYNRYFTETFFGQFVGQPPLLQNPSVSYGTLSNFSPSSSFVFPGNVFTADQKGKLPTVMNYSLSVQRDIGFGTIVDVGYAGSLGRHLFWRRDINPIPIGADFVPSNFDPTTPGKALPAAFLRPVVGYNNVYDLEGASSSNYNSLQVTGRRRFSHGLQFGASWTWSKSMDYNDNDTDNVTSLVNARVWNYGLASFDRTHVVTINYIWDIPGVRWRNLAARLAFDGWQLSGITSFVSGQPLSVDFTTVNATDISGTPSLSPRIYITGNPVLSKDQRTFSHNFRTDVFRVPATETIGNAARTEIRGPGINNWDMALFKNFPIHERMTAQFRAEAYNVFNHTQFSAIDTIARFDAAGNQVNGRFGEFTAARNPRIMQFALRFQF